VSRRRSRATVLSHDHQMRRPAWRSNEVASNRPLGTPWRLCWPPGNRRAYLGLEDRAASSFARLVCGRARAFVRAYTATKVTLARKLEIGKRLALLYGELVAIQPYLGRTAGWGICFGNLQRLRMPILPWNLRHHPDFVGLSHSHDLRIVQTIQEG
jgi:hypothetical protein